MNYQGGAPQLMVPPFAGMVKKLIVLHAVVWLVFVIVVQGIFLQGQGVFAYFGLVPGRVIYDFFLWQPFTYMFLHSANVFHIVFNMLVVWMFGSELEGRWGSRFFLTYYLVCGIGAAIFYLVFISIYSFITGDIVSLSTPVVGASGAVFGLILAYGLVFGERIVHFMMIFPMKAKYFALILGLIEFLTLMSSGVSNDVANLAHLGGLVSGYIFLQFINRKLNPKSRRSESTTRKLRLVVDNEKPKYWN